MTENETTARLRNEREHLLTLVIRYMGQQSETNRMHPNCRNPYDDLRRFIDKLNEREVERGLVGKPHRHNAGCYGLRTGNRTHCGYFEGEPERAE